MFSIPSPSSKNSQSTTNIQKDNKKITNSESHFIPGSSVLDVNYYYICLLINDKDTSSSDYYIPNLIMKRITPVFIIFYYYYQYIYFFSQKKEIDLEVNINY